MPTPEFRPRSVTVSKWDVFRRSLLYILVLLMAGNSVVSTIGVTLIRQAQVTNSGISKNTNLTAHQVKQIFTQFEDCIQPTGTCYKAGQKRTATALVGLEHVILASATCAAEPNLPSDPHARQSAVSMCVAHLLNTGGN